jgi:hypothetical protein
MGQFFEALKHVTDVKESITKRANRGAIPRAASS